MARSKNSITFFLPDELVSKILVFLPVISLLQCKLVCKTWLSIISNPQFIETQLIESRKKQSSLLHVFRNSIFIDDYLYVLNFFNWSIERVCSCNGLVCVSNKATDVIYLGNPMTRRFKKLPPPSQQPDSDDFLLGFGFDDISNDYKILRISQVYELEGVDDDGYDIEYCAFGAEMYSANDDSWKQIQIPETLEYFPFSRFVCVNLKGSRVLYMEGQDELLSFDLHDEVFRVYRYPISYPMSSHYHHRKSYVLDFEGSVALIFNESTNDGSVPSLWTLNEVLGNWSWTKEFNLDNDDDDDDFKEIKITSLYIGDGDYKKKHVKRILHYAPLVVRKCTQYTETLVSLEGFEQLE